MKVFGNNKRRRSAHSPRQTELPQTDKASQMQAAKINQSRITSHTRAVLLLLAAVCVFAASAGMCLLLLVQSAKAEAVPVQTSKSISYVVNVQPPATENIPNELEPPESVNNSNILNILLLGIDDATERTDTIVLTSVNLSTKEIAFLSIPRDTYVSGNLKYPAVYNVYKEAGGEERGIKAVMEKVKEMVGYWPDYYFVLDKQTMTKLLDITGKIDFDVPTEPAYSEVNSGYQSLNGTKAMQLLTFRSDYYEISAEPTRVQRAFLQTLLAALLKDENTIDSNARAIASFAKTNLSSDNLAYFGHLLRDVDMLSTYSRALPGEEIKAKEGSFYQVNPLESLPILNEIFNPLPDELTEYDLNFRQLTGDSGEGQYSAFGFGNGRNNTTGNTTSTEPSSSETAATEEATEPPTETSAEPTASESADTP